MLPARLFAGLTLAFSICAGLAWLFAWPAADIAVHDRYFLFGPSLVPLFCALTCANFAVLYYAAVRIFHAKWNRTLSFVHFALSVCFGVFGSVVFPMAAHYGNGANAGEVALVWVFVALLLGILSFVASYVIFAISLMSVAVQIVRARLASR
jgi:hypothetical protein